MDKSVQVFEKLKTARLIALLTPASGEQCLRAYELLRPAGIVLEIAFRSAFALEGIEMITSRHADALVLAGTVMTARQATDAIRAGAAGVVSADYVPEVVEVCAKRDVMVVPGGLGDAGKQLAQKAACYGCSLEELRERHPYQWIYKLFPAATRSGGLANMDLALAWRGPYRDLTVIYTGGISLDNIAAAARVDPSGVFCGSALARRADEADALGAEVEMWKAALEPAKAESGAPRIREATGGAGRKRVVAFGELMMRLSPSQGERLGHADRFELRFGGAEANVAVSLGRFGLDSSFVSALPDNELGDNAVGVLRGLGVGTEHIFRRGPRMGIYFLEHGAGPRPSKVLYDRLPSAFSELKPGDLDWSRILRGAHWLHWTGITPALGDGVAGILAEALREAKSCGLTVSADLNYRKKLWSAEKARRVLGGLMQYVDVLVANEEDPEAVFGIGQSGADLERGKLEAAAYEAVAQELMKRFGFKKVAITLRRSLSASENEWSACMHDGENFMLSREHRIFIVDRVGAGDAFAAGLIYGLISGWSDKDALEFGVAASCLKHSIRGDFNLVTVAEVERLAAGRTGGRVQR